MLPIIDLRNRIRIFNYRTGISYVPKQYTINYNTTLQYLSTCSNSGGIESVYIITEQELQYEKPDMTHWKALGEKYVTHTSTDYQQERQRSNMS